MEDEALVAKSSEILRNGDIEWQPLALTLVEYPKGIFFRKILFECDFCVLNIIFKHLNVIRRRFTWEILCIYKPFTFRNWRWICITYFV